MTDTKALIAEARKFAGELNGGGPNLDVLAIAFSRLADALERAEWVVVLAKSHAHPYVGRGERCALCAALDAYDKGETK